jgi:hypothetical protein
MNKARSRAKRFSAKPCYTSPLHREQENAKNAAANPTVPPFSDSTDFSFHVSTNAAMTDSKSLDSSTRLTRDVLTTLPNRSLHRARNWSKADVYLCEWPSGSGQKIVIKDLKRCPLWFRFLIGRSFLRREWNALCALRDMNEVPLPIARPDADSIAMEYRPGKSVKRFKRGLLPREVLQRIEDVISQLHARGVTHGDLHRKNVMVGEDGEVTLIDWATACVFAPQLKGSKPKGLRERAFSEWQALDNRALVKMKQYHFPHALGHEEKQILTDGGSSLYEFVKRLRRVLHAVHRKRR